MTSTAPGGSSGGATDPSSRRLFLLQAVVIALLLTLFGRLYFLQIASGTTAASLANATREKHVITEAKRGVIVDDSGQKLVDNEAAVEVLLSRTTLDSQKKSVREGVLNRLGGLLTIAPSDIAKDVEPCQKASKNVKANPPPTCNPGSPYQPVAIATYQESGPHKVDPGKILTIEMQIKEHPQYYPGVVVDTVAARSYPVGGAVPGTTLAAQTLGHLGPIASTDFDAATAQTRAGPYVNEQGLLTTTEVGDNNKVTTMSKREDVGRGGLEQQYDAELRGLDGDETLTVDSTGKVDGSQKKTLPVQGDDLVLNVDDKIQLAAEKALQDGINSSRQLGTKYGDASDGAAAVVMTTDGRLVALASTPSFDERAYESNKSYNQLTADATRPLTNRATSGIYAPGSAFKPITSSALLGDGLYSAGGGLDCPATYKVGNQIFHNFEGEAPHGGDLQYMLEVSCDTIFAKFADQQWINDGEYRLKEPKGAPPAHEYLAKMAQAYGFGGFTGIDIPEASPGIVVDRATRKKVFNENKANYCKGAKTRPQGSYVQLLDAENCADGYLYREGEAAQFAIGQGADLEVTPLQMARAYAAIANGGTLYDPTLGKALLRPGGAVDQLITPKKHGTVPVSKADLAYIAGGMFKVTHGPNGTAQSVFGDYPVNVCGKTGTAEATNVDALGNQTSSTDTSWFGSFGPCGPGETPKYVVMVVVPKSNQGALIAAPVAREIYNAIFQVTGKKVGAPGGPTQGELPCFKADGQIGAPNPHCPHPQSPPLAQLQVVVPQTPASSPPGLLQTPAAVVPDRRTSAKPKASTSRSVSP